MSKAPKLRFKEFSGDWEEDELGNIIEISKSKYNPLKNEEDYKCIELENLSQETGQLLGYFNSKEQQSIKNKFNKGEVLFGKLRPYLKKYWLADFEGVCSSEIWVLNGIKASNNFIYRLIQTDKFNFISNISSGSKMPRADWSYMREFPFFIPKLEEQEKIASFFSLIDEKIYLQGEKVEVLKDYKTGMMQKIFSRELRFKNDEGRDYPEWEHKKLNRIVERITRKNKGTICTLPLTISAQYGLVDQVTFFNKTVASANLEGYYLLEKGEFAYNKSYSTGYPFGAIKRLDRYDRGVLSSLYICFSILEGVDSDFLVQYFETSCWHKEISMIAVEGARNHGLLNISVSDFFETYHWIPCYDEQVKIGEFLGKIDEKINKEQEKLDSLNEYKKGLLQKMFV